MMQPAPWPRVWPALVSVAMMALAAWIVVQVVL